jgi:KDO2-lipid IV(A) lauroyltransferase
MWQLAPFLAEWRGMPTFHLAMAEEPNPLVQSFEQRFRERFKIIYTTGSPFAVLQLAKVLREGGILGLQLDRHIGGQTLALPFCGRTAWFPAGPATLARLTGAPLLASFFVRDDASSRPRIIHYLEPPIYVERTADRDADITAAMTKLVATYERFVRRFPTQWYHFFDFFHQPSGPDLSDAKSSPPQLAAGPALPAGGSR